MADKDAQTDLGFAVIDDGRAARTGLAEVVFGQGKTPEQLASILEHLVRTGHAGLATRVDLELAAAVRARLPAAVYEPIPRLLWLAGPDGPPKVQHKPLVAVVSAGTSDQRVAEEAARCAEWFGLRVERHPDLGVAGLQRLLSRVEQLRAARVVIAVAGLEGALPSVLAGLVSAPVIGVPTSVGYGVAHGGFTALHAMATSCAGGIGVVNIDNGFGAAQLAWRIVAGGAR